MEEVDIMVEKTDIDELFFKLEELMEKRTDELIKELKKGEDFNLEKLMVNDEINNQNIKKLFSQLDVQLPRKI